mmetsp:Transcript_6710/g.14049  ORF Transcript_6710/g.14049 Transcript_6710/m.14049 type:complete len:91 (+) Transcript_6710:142-414(+)
MPNNKEKRKKEPLADVTSTTIRTENIQPSTSRKIDGKHKCSEPRQLNRKLSIDITCGKVHKKPIFYPPTPPPEKPERKQPLFDHDYDKVE